MEDRQTQIQVGAGLQESRLNTDLIAWLEKWGTWILTVILVIVGAYAGINWYKRDQADKLDAAFTEYDAARGLPGPDGVLTGRPDNLLKIAHDHASRGSVPILATLDAAEIYLGSARRGLLPGTDLAAVKPEDIVTPEKNDEFLKSAESLFTRVAAMTEHKDAMGLLEARADMGLAAVAISRGDIEAARAKLTEVETEATKLGFLEFAAEAKRRRESLDRFAQAPVLLADADLPALPTPPGPEPDPNSPIMDMEMMPEGWTPPGLEDGKLPKVGESIPLPPGTRLPEGDVPAPPPPPVTDNPKPPEAPKP